MTDILNDLLIHEPTIKVEMTADECNALIRRAFDLGRRHGGEEIIDVMEKSIEAARLAQDAFKKQP